MDEEELAQLYLKVRHAHELSRHPKCRGISAVRRLRNRRIVARGRDGEGIHLPRTEL